VARRERERSPRGNSRSSEVSAGLRAPCRRARQSGGCRLRLALPVAAPTTGRARGARGGGRVRVLRGPSVPIGASPRAGSHRVRSRGGACRGEVRGEVSAWPPRKERTTSDPCARNPPLSPRLKRPPAASNRWAPSLESFAPVGGCPGPPGFEETQGTPLFGRRSRPRDVPSELRSRAGGTLRDPSPARSGETRRRDRPKLSEKSFLHPEDLAVPTRCEGHGRDDASRGEPRSCPAGSFCPSLRTSECECHIGECGCRGGNRTVTTLAVFRRVISRIPRGKVTTYGDVARAAGHPGAARLTVWALQRGVGLPWHRVVGAGGRIRLPGEDGREQRLRLELEGVTFRGNRVRLERHHWVPKMPRTRPERTK